jgi:hypothetical protein
MTASGTMDGLDLFRGDYTPLPAPVRRSLARRGRNGLKCVTCGKPLKGRQERFCSDKCYRRRKVTDKERACRECGKVFPIKGVGDANRRYCSQDCSKKRYTKQLATWRFEHPEHMAVYNSNRLAKNPQAWTGKARKERLAAISLLGGKCVVCGVKNPNWLHIDYIPTTRGIPFRHPRHLRFVRDHLSDFRLLCANHHYELTLTGRIEGTDITQ